MLIFEEDFVIKTHKDTSMGKFEEILKIVETLRGEDGCPWDKGQDHTSITPYLIEESYEVVDAINSGDDARLKEELGDLLLQVIFHAQIAEERGAFSIQDVLEALGSKLKLRHPHVFGNLEVKDKEDVLRNWERIKSEKGSDPLSGLPKGLPSLLLARRIQEKLSHLGVCHKIDIIQVEDGFKALKGAISKGDKDGIEKAIGEFLFLIVGLVLRMGVDAEGGLRKRVIEFLQREVQDDKKASSCRTVLSG